MPDVSDPRGGPRAGASTRVAKTPLHSQICMWPCAKTLIQDLPAGGGWGARARACSFIEKTQVPSTFVNMELALCKNLKICIPRSWGGDIPNPGRSGCPRCCEVDMAGAGTRVVRNLIHSQIWTALCTNLNAWANVRYPKSWGGLSRNLDAWAGARSCPSPSLKASRQGSPQSPPKTTPGVPPKVPMHPTRFCTAD